MLCKFVVFFLLLLVLVVVNTNYQIFAFHTASSTITSQWVAACNFSNTSASSNPYNPETALLLDNYASRSEARAILNRDPRAWQVTLPLDFTTITAASAYSAASPICAGRFSWRGFVAPFWVTSQVLESFAKSADDDDTVTLPALSAMDSTDLDYFASCDNTNDLVTTNPIRIKISNVAIGTSSGSTASWSFTDPSIPTTTLVADSSCDPNSSSIDTMKQFLRFFAVNGDSVQEIPVMGSSTSSNENENQYFQWVIDNDDSSSSSACPLSLGVTIDPSVCPATIAFTGATTVTFELTVEVATDPVIVWYMYTPSLICIFIGLVCLIFYIATFDKESKPETAKPAQASISISISIAKIFLVSGTVISAIALAITMVIDQHQPMLVGTPYSTILMGSLFCVSAILVVALGGVLSGKEDKRLKSMSPYIIAWLRLCSRALTLGACCAAWYRGFYIIGIIYVACQVFVEIGFWAALVSTFAGSHEPVRYGIAGDQMLTVSGLSLCGLYLVPCVGIVASASSRIFCLLEMSERFQVSKQFDDDEESDEAEQDEELQGLVPPPEQQQQQQGEVEQPQQLPEQQGEEEKNKKKKNKKSKKNKKNKKQNDDENGNESDANHQEKCSHLSKSALQKALDEEQDEMNREYYEEEIIDEEEIKDAFETFPVEWDGRLAAGFDGILSSRWWTLIFEVLFPIGLAVLLAHVHPPFTVYTICQFFISLAHFGAGFGIVTSQCGDGYGSGAEHTTAGSVLAGVPRDTIRAISKIPFTELEPPKEKSEEDENNNNQEEFDEFGNPILNNNMFSPNFYDDEEEEIDNNDDEEGLNDTRGSNPVRRPPPRIRSDVDPNSRHLPPPLSARRAKEQHHGQPPQRRPPPLRRNGPPPSRRQLPYQRQENTTARNEYGQEEQEQQQADPYSYRTNAGRNPTSTLALTNSTPQHQQQLYSSNNNKPSASSYSSNFYFNDDQQGDQVPPPLQQQQQYKSSGPSRSLNNQNNQNQHVVNTPRGNNTNQNNSNQNLPNDYDVPDRIRALQNMSHLVVYPDE